MEKENINNTSGTNRILKYGALAAGGFLLGRKVVKSLTKYKVKNKVILVTGGSRGLGLIIARQLADKKARIAICARNEEELRRAHKDLSERTKHVLTIPCDLTDKDQVKAMVQAVESQWGEIDVVINNAGMIEVGPMEAMKEEAFEQAMRLHFWAPFYIIHEVIPSMQRRRAGKIVNIVSIGGKVSFPHLLPYNVSKYALSGLSEGLTSELGKYNIQVTTVYPGLMRTGSPRNVDVKGQTEKEYAWFKLADSLPVISINAEKAAKRIIRAMREGEKTLTLSLPAKLATAVHGIAPDLNISLFDLVDRLLPDVGDAGDKSKKGHESETDLSQSFLTRETDKASAANNEVN